jgi:hypothetical protein
MMTELLEALPAEAGYTSNSISSGGDIAFMFCTRKGGTGQLVLKHWRPWEGDASVTKRIRLQLQIQ